MLDVGFEILPHAADLRVRVWGKKIEELFYAALRGAASCLGPEVLKYTKRELKEKKEIRIEAVDINSLLVGFLSEVVAQSDILNTIFPAVSFKKFGENFLEGELQGKKVDSFIKEIKAVSYDEVDIKKNQQTGLYETILVFDA